MRHGVLCFLACSVLLHAAAAQNPPQDQFAFWVAWSGDSMCNDTAKAIIVRAWQDNYCWTPAGSSGVSYQVRCDQSGSGAGTLSVFPNSSTCSGTPDGIQHFDDNYANNPAACTFDAPGQKYEAWTCRKPALEGNWMYTVIQNPEDFCAADAMLGVGERRLYKAGTCTADGDKWVTADCQGGQYLLDDNCADAECNSCSGQPFKNGEECFTDTQFGVTLSRDCTTWDAFDFKITGTIPNNAWATSAAVIGPACEETRRWEDLEEEDARGRMLTGGLGKLMKFGSHEVWACFFNTTCVNSQGPANPPAQVAFELAGPDAVYGTADDLPWADWMCYVYNEEQPAGAHAWMPWGFNSQLRLFSPLHQPPP